MSEHWSDEFLTMIDDCEKRDSRLSAWEHDFLVSMRDQIEGNRIPTRKQQETLENVWEKATANG